MFDHFDKDKHVELSRDITVDKPKKSKPQLNHNKKNQSYHHFYQFSNHYDLSLLQGRRQITIFPL
jgi:hypothetical protein